MTEPSTTAHEARSHDDAATCQHCLVPPPTNRSAKVAWTVAGVAVALLLAVFFLGGSTTLAGTSVAGVGGLTLLALLACPLMMGAMMWFMNKKGH